MRGSAKRFWTASPTVLISSKRGRSRIGSAGRRRNRRKERKRRDGWLWKCRAVESLENQRQVFHSSHRPWKSLPRFTFPQLRRLFLYIKTNTLARLKPPRQSNLPKAPEHAQTGLTEERARETYDIVTNVICFDSTTRTIIDVRKFGFCKLIMGRKTHRILGCHGLDRHVTSENALQLPRSASWASRS